MHMRACVRPAGDQRAGLRAHHNRRLHGWHVPVPFAAQASLKAIDHNQKWLNWILATGGLRVGSAAAAALYANGTGGWRGAPAACQVRRGSLGVGRAEDSTSFLPINGLDEVIGMISDTVFRKIVRDSRIVTPENIHLIV